MNSKMFFHRLGHFALFLGVLALFTAVVMWLWNGILPGVTGAGAINFWQALGLMVLGRILFGGFGHFKSIHKDWHRHMDRHDHFHKHPDYEHLHKNMRSMSMRERREYIRSRMMDGHSPGDQCNGQHETASGGDTEK